jgi:hypothetical protein
MACRTSWCSPSPASLSRGPHILSACSSLKSPPGRYQEGCCGPVAREVPMSASGHEEHPETHSSLDDRSNMIPLGLVNLSPRRLLVASVDPPVIPRMPSEAIPWRRDREDLRYELCCGRTPTQEHCSELKGRTVARIQGGHIGVVIVVMLERDLAIHRRHLCRQPLLLARQHGHRGLLAYIGMADRRQRCGIIHTITRPHDDALNCTLSKDSAVTFPAMCDTTPVEARLHMPATGPFSAANAVFATLGR